MLRYIAKRLLLLIPVVLGVSLIIFLIMSLTPGDPAMLILGEGAPPEALEAVREELGLNDPLPLRYATYIIDALRGDLGESYRTGIPVINEILVRLPYTVALATISIVIAVVIGLPIGVITAVKQYSVVDTTMLGISLLLTSMPGFFLAMMLMLIFSLNLGWFPTVFEDNLASYILPSIASASSTTAALLRMTRSTMLEVIRQDYIRTAHAKGASPRRVIYHHALRNSLLPVVTVIGVNFGVALGGSIVIEQVFSIPGLGQLMINSIRTKDTPMVMAAVIFAAIIASIVNLLVDIVYCYIDPRLTAQLTGTKKRKKVQA